MVPLYVLCPELADREIRNIVLPNALGSLPAGKYSFVEQYCNDLDCDCRRVFFSVVRPEQPEKVLASINFGWENEAFYRKQFRGNRQDVKNVRDGSLDPLNPQSEHAPELLSLFQEFLAGDAAYQARLARHYEAFKTELRAQRSQPAPAVVPDFSSTETILNQLQFVPEQAAFAPYRAALEAAIARREEIAEDLIAALDRVSDDPEYFQENIEDCLHEFAIYLLAQFRERRALEAMIRFFSLPDETAMDLTADILTEQGPAILASLCGGDPAPLIAIILDESRCGFLREQAIGALVVQAHWGERPRAAVVEDLRGLFGRMEMPGDIEVWTALVMAVLNLPAYELAPLVEAALAKKLVNTYMISKQEFARAARAADPSYAEDFRDDNLPIDAIKECAAWVCFHPELYNEDPEDIMDEVIDLPPAPYQAPLYSPPVPFRAPAKVGRNDPCPCGSGLKYKKCCGK